MTGNELAHEIAFDFCASIIVSYGVPKRDSRGHILWYEMDLNDQYGAYEIRRSLRYLKWRKALRVNQKFPNQVKLRAVTGKAAKNG